MKLKSVSLLKWHAFFWYMLFELTLHLIFYLCGLNVRILAIVYKKKKLN